MNKILSCRFNLDTACVETRFSDGTTMSIYTPSVDATLDITTKQQAEVDWLIYNNPVKYALLVMQGTLEEYVHDMSGYHSLTD